MILDLNIKRWTISRCNAHCNAHCNTLQRTLQRTATHYFWKYHELDRLTHVWPLYMRGSCIGSPTHLSCISCLMYSLCYRALLQGSFAKETYMSWRGSCIGSTTHLSCISYLMYSLCYRALLQNIASFVGLFCKRDLYELERLMYRLSNSSLMYLMSHVQPLL